MRCVEGGWSCRLGVMFVHMFQSQNGILIKFGTFFLIVLWTMSGHPFFNIVLLRIRCIQDVQDKLQNCS